MNYLTTHDDGDLETRHFAAKAELHAAVKAWLHRKMESESSTDLDLQALEDEVLRSESYQRVPEAARPDHLLSELHTLFQAEYTGGATITWGEVELPTGAPVPGPAWQLLRTLAALTRDGERTDEEITADGRYRMDPDDAIATLNRLITEARQLTHPV